MLYKIGSIHINITEIKIKSRINVDLDFFVCLPIYCDYCVLYIV